MYFNRGKNLQQLSMYEYDALIQVREKSVNPRTLCFDFAPNFDLAARYTQMLKAKQSTMIFKGKAPQHARKMPDTTTKRRQCKV